MRKMRALTGFYRIQSVNVSAGVYSAPLPLQGDASTTRGAEAVYGSRDEEGAPLIAKRPSLSFSV